MGKFASRLDERLYDLSLEGTEEEAGDVTEAGVWYGRLHLSHAEQEDLGAPFRDYILQEDNYGFVDVDQYASEEAARASFAKLEEGLDGGAD